MYQEKIKTSKENQLFNKKLILNTILDEELKHLLTIRY